MICTQCGTHISAYTLLSPVITEVLHHFDVPSIASPPYRPVGTDTYQQDLQDESPATFEKCNSMPNPFNLLTAEKLPLTSGTFPDTSDGILRTLHQYRTHSCCYTLYITVFATYNCPIQSRIKRAHSTGAHRHLLRPLIQTLNAESSAPHSTGTRGHPQWDKFLMINQRG